MNEYSMIDIGLWDQAEWKAVAYMAFENSPPAIGIIFGNEGAGTRIFRDWIDLLGRDDTRDILRVSIIEGDIPGEAPGYTVFLGTDAANFQAALRSQGRDPSERRILLVGRLNRMNPASGSPHLPLFKQNYSVHNEYTIVPVFGPSNDLQPEFDLGIRKHQIQFMNAATIGRQDQEIVALGDV